MKKWCFSVARRRFRLVLEGQASDKNDYFCLIRIPDTVLHFIVSVYLFVSFLLVAYNEAYVQCFITAAVPLTHDSLAHTEIFSYTHVRGWEF